MDGREGMRAGLAGRDRDCQYHSESSPSSLEEICTLKTVSALLQRLTARRARRGCAGPALAVQERPMVQTTERRSELRQGRIGWNHVVYICAKTNRHAWEQCESMRLAQICRLCCRG